jgi:acyl carrier protein
MVKQLIQEKVEDVVLNLLPAINRKDLSPDQDIFSLGLDSVHAMTLVLNLQQAFDVNFDPADFQFENFRTIANIVNLVQVKTQSHTL